MALPIRPSLSQILQTPATRPAQSTPVHPAHAEAPNSFANALAAQKAFFQQVTAPKITPATYTAEQINRATAQAPVPTPAQPEAGKPLLRPGSYLNIQV